ncbi:MAG: hypothetical protein GYA24_23470 [Candidatus Lokiarchaeota archaeon]|nr:hypothetical protein [Candidatus Lokiarchaeota archaeon]
MLKKKSYFSSMANVHPGNNTFKHCHVAGSTRVTRNGASGAPRSRTCPCPSISAGSPPCAPASYS